MGWQPAAPAEGTIEDLENIPTGQQKMNLLRENRHWKCPNK
jgi:hypothetical protein